MSLGEKKFDIYVGIDWSGAKSPVKSKSVALSWCYSGTGQPEFLTQSLSRQDVADWIIDYSKKGLSLLVGIDCNLSYSQTVLNQQFWPSCCVSDLWSEVENVNSGHKNFYAGAFWESQKYQSYFWTKGIKPGWFDEERLQRHTEGKCKFFKLGNPESPFKLIGAKQVGKGGLSGMRLAQYLKEQLNEKICIWPFQNNFLSASLVMTEIYPRLFLKHCGFGNRKIRSFTDLNTALKNLNSDFIISKDILNDHLSDAIISAAGLRYFIQDLSPSITKAFEINEEDRDLAKNEGWIFGVNHQFLNREDRHA